jgi:hypothetical protein
MGRRNSNAEHWGLRPASRTTVGGVAVSTRRGAAILRARGASRRRRLCRRGADRRLRGSAPCVRQGLARVGRLHARMPERARDHHSAWGSRRGRCGRSPETIASLAVASLAGWRQRPRLPRRRQAECRRESPRALCSQVESKRGIVESGKPAAHRRTRASAPGSRSPKAGPESSSQKAESVLLYSRLPEVSRCAPLLRSPSLSISRAAGARRSSKAVNSLKRLKTAMGSYSKNDVWTPLWRRSEATETSVRRRHCFVSRPSAAAAAPSGIKRELEKKGGSHRHAEEVSRRRVSTFRMGRDLLPGTRSAIIL